MLERLLGSVSAADFFTRHFAQEPLLVRGAGAWACALATKEVCERLVDNPRVDLLLAREKQLWEAARPDALEAAKLFTDGWTWVLRDVDRADPELAEFGRGLASDVHGTLHLQLYRTPAARYGFGWHFDAEEVFFVQTEGRKKLKLRRNAQHPSPLSGALPVRLSAHAEQAPIVEHVLEPGDVLYIPGGWWHSADAIEETVSISCGLLAPSPLDALSMVMAELAADPAWRARLAPMGRASPLSEDERRALWSARLAELDAEVHRRLGAADLPTRLFASTGWWKQR